MHATRPVRILNALPPENRKETGHVSNKPTPPPPTAQNKLDRQWERLWDSVVFPHVSRTLSALCSLSSDFFAYLLTESWPLIPHWEFPSTNCFSLFKVAQVVPRAAPPHNVSLSAWCLLMPGKRNRHYNKKEVTQCRTLHPLLYTVLWILNCHGIPNCKPVMHYKQLMLHLAPYVLADGQTLGCPTESGEKQRWQSKITCRKWIPRKLFWLEFGETRQGKVSRKKGIANLVLSSVSCILRSPPFSLPFMLLF